MRFTKTGDRYVLKLERGEEVFATLEAFAAKENITFATVTALGAVDQISCGYYTLTDRQYHFTSYEGMFEVLNSTGNITIKNDVPFAHVHATFSNDKNEVFGGHVERMRVGLVLEVVLDTVPHTITRSLDKETGLNLMDL